MTDRESSHVRRPVILAAFALVLAVVLLVALRSWLDRPAVEIGVVEGSGVAADAAPVEQDFAAEQMVEPVVVVSSTPSSVPIPAASPTMKVIMLPARVQSTDPAAAVATESVRQSTLRALRAMPGMVVEEISLAELAAIAPPNAGPLGADSLLYFAVTSRHEGRVVAEIAEQTDAGSSAWQLDLRVLLGPTGGGNEGGRVGKNADLRPQGEVESVGIRYAERIARAAELIADGRSVDS